MAIVTFATCREIVKVCYGKVMLKGRRVKVDNITVKVINFLIKKEKHLKKYAHIFKTVKILIYFLFSTI